MDFTEWKGVSVLSNWKNIQKAKSIEHKNRERILAVNPHVDDGSGIYVLTRTDEDGFRFAYVGRYTYSKDWQGILMDTSTLIYP